MRVAAASSASASLATRLVASHAARDAAFDSFTRGLGRSERAGLIDQLDRRARRPDDGVAALLRALLHASSLRLVAAREAVRLMRSEVISGKAGVLCLSELRIAVLRHWERPGAGGTADEPTVPAAQYLNTCGSPPDTPSSGVH